MSDQSGGDWAGRTFGELTCPNYRRTRLLSQRYWTKPSTDGVKVPALYMGESDYVLSVSDEISEVFDITASLDGRPIITGHGFGGPQCGVDPRDDSPQRFAGMFGGFLGAHLECAELPDAWTVHDTNADLNALADACNMFGEEQGS